MARVAVINGQKVADLERPALEHRVSIRCEAGACERCSGRRVAQLAREAGGRRFVICECPCHGEHSI